MNDRCPSQCRKKVVCNMDGNHKAGVEGEPVQKGGFRSSQMGFNISLSPEIMKLCVC